MSRRTRRHPWTKLAPCPLKLRRIGPASYETIDGAITVENMNEGKRDAYWVARRKATGESVASATTLTEARRRLAKVLKEKASPS